MATKAERFNEEQQLAKHHQPKAPPHAKPARNGSHNEAPRAARHSSYELERSIEARPSRKSSRKSCNRQKHDGQLKLTALGRSSTPSQRAARQ